MTLLAPEVVQAEAGLVQQVAVQAEVVQAEVVQAEAGLVQQVAVVQAAPSTPVFHLCTPFLEVAEGPVPQVAVQAEVVQAEVVQAEVVQAEVVLPASTLSEASGLRLRRLWLLRLLLRLLWLLRLLLRLLLPVPVRPLPLRREHAPVLVLPSALVLALWQLLLPALWRLRRLAPWLAPALLLPLAHVPWQLPLLVFALRPLLDCAAQTGFVAPA